MYKLLQNKGDDPENAVQKIIAALKPLPDAGFKVMELQDPYDQIVKPRIVFPFSLTFAHGNKKIFCSYCK